MERRYVRVYEDFLESGSLSYMEKFLFITLKRFSYERDGNCVAEASYSVLAKVSGASVSGIRRAIRRMEEVGAIKTIHQQASNSGLLRNLYILNDDESTWRTSPDNKKPYICDPDSGNNKASEAKRGRGYVYRFLDKDGRVLYIGKTKNITSRLKEHGSHGHLKREQYELVDEVQAIELPTYNDAGVCERFFISKYNPIFNSAMTKEGAVTLQINLPEECEWKTIATGINAHERDGHEVRNKRAINCGNILKNVVMVDTTGHSFILYKRNGTIIEYIYCEQQEFNHCSSAAQQRYGRTPRWLPNKFVDEFISQINEMGIPFVYGTELGTNTYWRGAWKKEWANPDTLSAEELKEYEFYKEMYSEECDHVSLTKLLNHPEKDFQYYNQDYRINVRAQVIAYMQKSI